MRLALHLHGLILLREKDTAAAVKKLEETVSLLPSQSSDEDEHALYHDALAEAFYRKGDFEKAKREYEKIVSLTTGRLFYGDIYARSFFRLGELFEKKGETAKAVESFRKFLQLRQESMPDSSEVGEARKRIN
jgi:tetratricopeptide (TPR) repeat protein